MALSKHRPKLPYDVYDRFGLALTWPEIDENTD